MADIKMGVIGCGGRMGRMLVIEVAAGEGMVLSGGCTTPGGALVGRDIGEMAGIGLLGLAAGGDAEKHIAESDVAIDYTRPAATARHAAIAARLHKPIVIGTTGLSQDEEAAVREAARRVPMVWAANTSLGINLLLGLVEQVASRLGPDWDVEIMEMHHRGKADAPSGTALALGRAVAEARGVSLDAVAQRGRDGITGPRKPG
ncbi:MAG: 4-hydroxy-tetrahydrodipicolinate reductase, partial [Stellaceae bacterium]